MTNTSSLKEQIVAEMKSAMKSGDKERLATIRLILSAVKQVEVDTRSDVNDQDLIGILDKMSKQRRESIDQFEQAGRNDLADKEKSELAIISDYLPQALSEAEVNLLIDQAVSQTSASSMKEMGAVMAILKPQMQGRADMSKVSKLIKARLSS
ncbi:MAG: GatB/YqeY domain-containing protein [Gammaproteobacteria bacterium]|nr:GatB/YqeY domain-containing protein [Gammaproteobacteria bacterium]